MNADAVITEQFTFTSYHGGKSVMLYDLKKDPSENTNVADRSEYKKTVSKMAALLQKRQKEAARREKN